MNILVVKTAADGQTSAALVDGEGSLTAIASSGARALQENSICVAIAQRHMASLHAQFVLLPEGEKGFLQPGEGGQTPPSGQKLLVQVRRPAFGKKSALVSESVTLAGKWLVLCPTDTHVALSRSIAPDDPLRERLRTLGKSLQAEDPLHSGLILRSTALGENWEEDLRREHRTLCARWQQIAQAFQQAAEPAVLYSEAADPVSTLLRECHWAVDHVLTDRDDFSLPQVSCPVRHAADPFAVYNIPGQLAALSKHCVWLKSGASITVDPCEAAVLVDVNTGKAPLHGERSAAFHRINAEALPMIARLLRVRGLAGSILIDLVDTPTAAQAEELLALMRACTQEDPCPVQVLDITPLGILELSRKRTGAPRSVTAPVLCPLCGGSGVLCRQIKEMDSDGQ